MFGITGLRGKTSILFGAYFLLVAVSVGVTFWGITAQKSDALIINLAGRQRMLTQQITWLALNRPESADLAASILRFEQNHRALHDGGPALDGILRPVTLPPAPDDELRDRLDEVSQSWESFKIKMAILNAMSVSDPARAGAAGDFQAESLLLLSRLDTVVGAFETRAQAKVARLMWIQGGFLAVALGLLLWGYRLTHRNLVVPLTDLSETARRIGDGHLAQPVLPLYKDEMGELSEALETMRGELAGARRTLEERVDQRTRELTAAFEFSREIVAQLDLDHLLHSVVERAGMLGRTDSAALCLLNHEDQTLELVASRGGMWEGPVLQQPIRQGMPSQVIGEGRTVITRSECAGCGFLHARGPGNCLATPLCVGTQTLGALCVSRNSGETYDQDEGRALSLLANSAAIAITNARLTNARQREVRSMAALAEREHLAAELHDSLAQSLSFLRMKVENVEEAVKKDQPVRALETLGRMKPALEAAYSQIRDALSGLRQPPPAGEDFARRLTDCTQEFQELSGISIEMDIQDPAALELSSNVQVQVIHILRSALTNIHLHAHAHQVKVRAEYRAGEAWFTVSDDGVGFDPQIVGEGDHLGLVIMRTRAERSGGRLILESAPRKGTKVVACFPVPS